MQPLSLYTKTAFGVGQAAEGIKNVAFNAFLLFYYNQVLGLSGTETGLALFVATAFDALTDPLAGSLSDRLHHRWGRRHPFMYASALPLGVTFALLFGPPADLDQGELFFWLLAFAVLVRTSMTLYHVPHLALGAELSDDYRERTTIVAFRTGFGVLGGGLTYGLAWGYFFRSTPGFESGQLDRAVYPDFGLLFGALMIAAILFSAWGTRDQIPRLPRPPKDREPFGLRQLARDYGGALSNGSFRSLFTGLIVFFVMRGIQEVLQVHMATFFWELDPQRILVISLAAVPGLLVGVPFWAVMAHRIDKKPTFLVGIVCFSACVLIPPIAKIAGAFPALESPLYVGTLAAATGLAAFGAMAAIVTAGSMMADIADEHELDSGRRQEGIFFGALAFAVKSMSGVGTLLAGLALDLIAFPTQVEPGTVDPSTVEALGILYGPGIGLLAVIAIAFLARYRIDHRRHAEIAAALGRRRAQSK